jgi:hypothetical protein
MKDLRRITMQRSAILVFTAGLIAAAACTHAPPPPAGHDWEHGLDGSLSSQIAPVGPIDSDVNGYNLIRRREQERALGTKDTLVELDEIVGNSSQVLASALALPLFQAGVFLGEPPLIDKACAAARRVTHPSLRSSGNVETVLQGCGALTVGKQSNDPCSEGEKKLREAYAQLAANKSVDAGHAAADGVRMLRDRCPKMLAPLRTPVDPGSHGFLIVWTLHANDAPPTTFLAGMPPPATAEAINEAFLRGVQAVKGVARNP